MQWLVQEREVTDARIETAIGLLGSIQRLLRLPDTDPCRVTCSDETVVSVLDLAKEHLGVALRANAQPSTQQEQ